jgi:Arc/MetJ-type ribon-helix-helix transcriptional regulator
VRLARAEGVKACSSSGGGWNGPACAAPKTSSSRRGSAHLLPRLLLVADPGAVQARAYTAAVLRVIAARRELPDDDSPSYDRVMKGRKVRLEINVDPHLSAYAEHLVATGKAPSLSAVVNDALSEKARRDRQALDRLKETAAQADSAKVNRMLAHVDAQAAALHKR